MRLYVKNVIALFAMAAIAVAAAPSGSFPAKRLKEVDARIDTLLKAMTLEEKIGQMTQVTIDVVSKGADGRDEPHAVDTAKLRDAILRYHVGSILNVGPSFYSVAHWHEVISAIQDVALKESRLSIPILYGIDAVHGANYTEGATLFPQSIALAATWDPGILRRVGEITAFEVRASGIPWNFHPVLDLGRQPLWPRLWETYGEDVTLAKTLGLAYMDGLMGQDMSAREHLAPCLKHYAGYSMPLSGKDRTPAWIDERMMREYSLPTFEAAVRAGAPTVMVNSGEINGIPGHANYHLLTEILKQEWEFDGFVVSDWEDIKRLHTRDRVADSQEEAVRLAVMAGVDMSMVPNDFSFYTLLLDLVNNGKIPHSRIDDAVRRILRVKFLVGLFDNPYPDQSMAATFASPEWTVFNRKTAQESMTLLKNERGILPLDKDVRVLVTGPTANLLHVLNSGWTITWQGDNESLYPKNKPTILRAIQAKIGEGRVTYVAGSTFDALTDVDRAVREAAGADVIIACLGEKAYCETPGNVNDLTLEKAQLDLVDELSKTGKPIVLVLVEGRPRIIHRIVDRVQGIVLGFLPGMEGGSAIADVLFGDVNPSGKLPVSYPKYPNSLTLYDCKPAEVADGNTYDPEFRFGYGLSYTMFAYSDLVLDRPILDGKDSLVVSVTVGNTGQVPGKEVVQLYVTDLYRSVTPPIRELKAFRKIDLQPGERKTVTFALREADLTFIGREYKRIAEKGKFRVTIDRLSQEFELR